MMNYYRVFFKDFYEVSKVTRIRKNSRLHKGKSYLLQQRAINSNIGQCMREANDGHVLVIIRSRGARRYQFYRLRNDIINATSERRKEGHL